MLSNEHIHTIALRSGSSHHYYMLSSEHIQSHAHGSTQLINNRSCMFSSVNPEACDCALVWADVYSDNEGARHHPCLSSTYLRPEISKCGPQEVYEGRVHAGTQGQGLFGNSYVRFIGTYIPTDPNSDSQGLSRWGFEKSLVAANLKKHPTP